MQVDRCFKVLFSVCPCSLPCAWEAVDAAVQMFLSAGFLAPCACARVWQACFKTDRCFEALFLARAWEAVVAAVSLFNVFFVPVV